MFNCTSVQATAADFAHATRPSARDFLNDKENCEDTNASRVKDRVYLVKSLTLGTSCKSDTNSNELSIIGKEGHHCVFIFVIIEDLRVGDHIEPHEQMKQEGPLNDASCLICQV